jgi:hypothetical protein
MNDVQGISSLGYICISLAKVFRVESLPCKDWNNNSIQI